MRRWIAEKLGEKRWLALKRAGITGLSFLLATTTTFVTSQAFGHLWDEPLRSMLVGFLTITLNRLASRFPVK